MTTHAIILAAGAGSRVGGDIPKQYRSIAGKPMIAHSVQAFAKHPQIDRLWVVIGEGQEAIARSALNDIADVGYVIGAVRRQDSVANALAAIAAAGGATHVLVHDAARPFLPHVVIDRLLSALDGAQAAIPVLPMFDSLVDASAGPVDRARLQRVQTPQAFTFALLQAAHTAWPADQDASDDASMVHALGAEVMLVEGDERLKKVTTAHDFSEQPPSPPDIRTGMGFDVHRLVPGRELWLGGVLIPYARGLLGHSDADVALHALTDAILGAISAGDIGDHFPPSDPQWQDAASSRFVEYAAAMVAARGGTISHVDITILCEEPKLKPHREAIRAQISSLLAIPLDRVSLKATTSEGLGFAGRGEGIAAQAVATVLL